MVNIIEMERIKVVEALLFATGCFGLGRSIGIGKNLTAIYRSVFTTVKKRKGKKVCKSQEGKTFFNSNSINY